MNRVRWKTALACVAILAVIYGMNTCAPPVRVGEFGGFDTEEERAWTRARMKYHGVDVVECNGKNDCWFYRDGKRCKL